MAVLGEEKVDVDKLIALFKDNENESKELFAILDEIVK